MMVVGMNSGQMVIMVIEKQMISGDAQIVEKTIMEYYIRIYVQ